jgi:hypothetical protein
VESTRRASHVSSAGRCCPHSSELSTNTRCPSLGPPANSLKYAMWSEPTRRFSASNHTTDASSAARAHVRPPQAAAAPATMKSGAYAGSR